MDGDPLFWQILLQIALIFLNAVFACAEIAVISINDAKLEKLSASGNKKAKRLLSLVRSPSDFLATIQVGITLAGFLGSAFAADNFAGKLVGWLVSIGVNISPSMLNTVSVILITLVLSYFTLVLGELVPKRVAMKRAEGIGLAMAGPICVMAKIFKPIIWLLTASTNVLLRLLGIDPNANDSEITEDEIRLMIDAGTEKGTIEEDEKAFIHNIFEFNDNSVGEIMTHRTDVDFLWLEEDVEKWEDTMVKARHSNYPICGESTDEIVGILNIKDYYSLKEKSVEAAMKKAVRPPYFVPETVKNDILFRNMKLSRNHFAVVLDEYAGVSGVVTMNDLLEELVGDLEDDMSVPPEEPFIEKSDPSTWTIRGVAPLDDVARELGVELPLDDYETFGGMVFGLLGNVPEDGTTPELEEFGLMVKVLEIKEHRLEKAAVIVVDGAAAEG